MGLFATVALLTGACQATPTLGQQACAAALLEGTLVERAGTLLVDPSWGEPQVVDWPDGIGVAQTQMGWALVGFFGQTIAREGDSISVGGGEFDGVWQACGEIGVNEPGS